MMVNSTYGYLYPNSGHLTLDKLNFKFQALYKTTRIESRASIIFSARFREMWTGCASIGNSKLFALQI